MRKCLVLGALVALAISSAGAQATAVDSMLVLTRSGQTAAAIDFIRSHLPAASSALERCQFRVGMITSMARLRQLDSTIRALDAFDAQCPDSIFRADPGWLRDVGVIRTGIAPLREQASMPPLPKSGLDLTFFDLFWPIVDTLSRDVSVGDSTWAALRRTPGYRLAAEIDLNLQRAIEIAVRPSMRARLDSIMARPSEAQVAVPHIARAVAMRARLVSLADSLRRNNGIAAAVRRAAELLPPGATDGGDPPPLVAVALFRDDGYAQEEAIVVDLLYILENGLGDLLAHEFHHMYVGRATRVSLPPQGSRDFALMRALYVTRNEGIADLIDKPYPLTAQTNYARTYNATYASTPTRLRQLDSVLMLVAADSMAAQRVGARIGTILPNNGHANGAYMARTILQTFGRDSLVPAVWSQFAFYRIYAAAEVRKGGLSPLSPESLALLESLERKYAKR